MCKPQLSLEKKTWNHTRAGSQEGALIWFWIFFSLQLFGTRTKQSSHMSSTQIVEGSLENLDFASTLEKHPEFPGW